MNRVRPAAMPLSATLIGILVVSGAHPLAAQTPVDAVLSDFKLSGDFFFELDGEELESTEIYQSQRAAAFLILAPDPSSPLLISPRTGSVEGVPPDKIARREDGTLDLLADAELEPLGTFLLSGNEVVFQVGGRPAKLKPKPPLLGESEAEALKRYKPEYGRAAAEYTPDPRSLSVLRSQSKEIRVRVYFGTWCPVCGRLAPRLLAMADQLEGSRIRFEYYGLPQPMSDDPVTEREKIEGVPTAIVFVGGNEIGRLSIREMNAPETAIVRLLEAGKP